MEKIIIPLDVKELIEGCKSGDNASMEILYNLYVRKMKGMVYRYARTNSDMDDIIQEGFIRIYQNISSYNYNGSFEGWMKKIIINTAINYYKKYLKQRSEIPFEDSGVDEEKSVDMIDSFSIEELHNLINKLPEGYRFVLNLYAIEGYSHKEIGEMLKIGENSSTSQYFRAKKSLLKLIEKSSYIQKRDE